MWMILCIWDTNHVQILYTNKHKHFLNLPSLQLFNYTPALQTQSIHTTAQPLREISLPLHVSIAASHN